MSDDYTARLLARARELGHLGVAKDELRAEDNAKAGAALCDHCDGTGNEFMFMYRACPKCDGTGIAKSTPQMSGFKEKR